MRLIICTAVLAALALTSCHSSKPDAETFIVNFEAMDAVAAESRTSFARGETIRFRLRIHWTGRSDTIVSYGHRGVVVTNLAGERVWYAPESSHTSIQKETWLPGQVRTLDFTWTNQHPNGATTPVSAGSYRASADPVGLPDHGSSRPFGFDIVAAGG